MPLDQHQIACNALHQCAYSRCISFAFDKIAFPLDLTSVPRHQAVFNLWRPYMDADQVKYLPTAIYAT